MWRVSTSHKVPSIFFIKVESEASSQTNSGFFLKGPILLKDNLFKTNQTSLLFINKVMYNVITVYPSR